jgi:hypothetical protein
MSGITGTQMEQLYSLAASITKNTYTTKAAFTGVLGTNTVCKLAGGYFGNDNPNPVGRTLYLVIEGTIATTSAATIALELGFDPTAGTSANPVTVMAATAPVATFTAPFHFYAWYTCTAFVTSQMTLQVNGRWAMEGANAGGAAVSTALATGFQGSISGATMDPRVDNYIELFGTWSASAAGNTTTVHQMDLFGLN